MPARATRSGCVPDDRLPAELHRAARLDHPRERAQGRGLARAICTEDDDDLAFVDGEVDAVQHLDRPVAGAQLRDLENGHAHPQVRLDDGRVVADVVRDALGDLAAEVEHDDVLGDRHHHRHVVFDEEHGERELVADLAHE